MGSTIQSWREVINPHPDIRAGKFDESVFAADLSDVVAGRGPLEYRDVVTFFRKTYPTQGLINLLATIACRLSGQGRGEGVIQIQTPFGGGKTHSLIALYHLFKNTAGLRESEIVRQVLERASVGGLPEVRVATFTGTAADPIKGKTPWGELAEHLGSYTLLAEHDQRRRSPGKDRLHELLAGKPTLILMDEIAEYVVKARDFREQVIVFFQELTETVKVLPQCALVVTLPSSAPYGEEGERVLHQLQQVFGRVEAIYTPVEGEEIYEIIRRRLFEDTPDPSEVWRVAESYWDMYGRLGEDVPREVREPTYRDKLRKAFPFHPELIDLLYERWSTFATFQRTRGVLRLLAEVVADLYKRQHPAPIIQPAHLNLSNPAIRRELLKHIGNEYEGVIAADIADGNAKAQRLDREMGSEYARFGIATGLATAIFFGSFSGSERKGLGIQRLRLALLQKEIPPPLVRDTLSRLEEVLWYLHVEEGLYSFSSQPNLNRVIVEREEAVGDALIKEEIRTRLEKLAGSEVRVTLWPQVSQDVPDTKELKLAILPLEHTKSNTQTSSVVSELLQKCGTTFRTYRNTLIVLAPDASELSSLCQKVKRFLALRAIYDDKPLMRQLSEPNKKTLESRLKDVEGNMVSSLRSAYRHLAKLSEEGVKWFDLGLPTVGERGSLAQRIMDYLEGEELLLKQISPLNLLRKALREDEHEKPFPDLVDIFRRYPQLPMLGDPTVIKQAVRQGVHDGVFAIKSGDQVYYKDTLPDSLLDAGAILLRHEHAQPVKSLTNSRSQLSETNTPTPTEQDKSDSSFGKRLSDSGVHDWKLRVRVPWDKLSDFVRGVVLPLHNDGATLEIEVSLQARSGSGNIKSTTLEQTVKETLRQIKAEIVEESIGEATSSPNLR